MKKYVAILKQEGGCYYTIGCGNTHVYFEAENTVSAASKLLDIVRENYSSSETRLSNIKFHEIIENFEVDVKIWYGIIDGEREQEKADQARQNELALLEQLKKKYEL